MFVPNVLILIKLWGAKSKWLHHILYRMHSQVKWGNNNTPIFGFFRRCKATKNTTHGYMNYHQSEFLEKDMKIPKRLKCLKHYTSRLAIYSDIIETPEEIQIMIYTLIEESTQDAKFKNHLVLSRTIVRIYKECNLKCFITNK